MDIITAIKQRHTCRAFLAKPVATELVEQILSAASWAPSGVNTQPWHVHVLTGKAKDTLSSALIAARQAETPANPDYAYYPTTWDAVYATRRKDCGIRLYKALDIKKDDPEARLKAWNNNYTFFGAPVGMLFTLDASLNTGSYVDMGMFLQNIMLAALAFGLATCPQASLAEFPDIVRKQLGLADEQVVLCGMSLGYPDMDHPVNNYRLDRAAVTEFTKWYKD